MRYIALSVLLSVGSAAMAAGGASWIFYPTSTVNVAEAGGLGVLAEGSSAMGLNPARLGAGTGAGEVHFSHSAWAGDIRTESLGISMAGPGNIHGGLSGRWVDFGSIQGYQVGSAGVEATDVIRPSAGNLDLALSLPIGVGGLKVGAGGGILMQNLEGKQNSLAAAFQAGVVVPLGAGFEAGASAVNLGGSLDGSDLPGQARAGIAFAMPSGSFRAGVELAQDIRGSARPDFVGALSLRLAEPIRLRLGWSQLDGAEGSASAGLSFRLAGNWGLDYAYRSQGSFGASHHVGLDFRWG